MPVSPCTLIPHGRPSPVGCAAGVEPAAISIVYGRMLNAVEISDSFVLLLGAFRD